jgi:NCAIR mutase (PurE)-related protein
VDRAELKALLLRVETGGISIDDALEELAILPYEDLKHAKIDHHRALRHGFAEVVLGEGKTAEQFGAIFETLARRTSRVLATRVDPELAAVGLTTVPDSEYHQDARILSLDRQPLEKRPGVSVVSAGTADVRVAEEAAITAEIMGNQVQRLYDLGVAGLHRLVDALPALRSSRVVVVVAGMDGALPSVLAGLVSVPVVAVPTSAGYGASLGGIAALLTMLNSCASGVSVVNIDNGFGAGTIASMINRPVERPCP